MKNYRKVLDQLEGEYRYIRQQIRNLIEKKEELEEEIKNCEQVQTIIQTVAQLTQEELKYHVSELVTLALASVFPNPYEFEIEFVQRRNQTECDLWFRRDGVKVDPISASGGGAVDVADFALRVTLWSLQEPRCRPIFILDEPLKWLKGGDLPKKGALMIKEVADELKLQILMISHIPDQIEGADRVFKIQLKKGVSKIT